MVSVYFDVGMDQHWWWWYFEQEFIHTKKIPTAKVMMLKRSTWSHSTRNFPENFLSPFKGLGDRYKAPSGINIG